MLQVYSNYFFTLHRQRHSDNGSLVERLRRFHDVKRWKRKYGAVGMHLNEWNMYVRVLSRQFDRGHNVTERDLDTAKRELDRFDLVTVLEMDGAADLWRIKYGVDVLHLNSQSDHKHSQKEEAFAVERRKNPLFDKEFERFEREFKTVNYVDCLLYEYAKRLHRQFSAQYLYELL